MANRDPRVHPSQGDRLKVPGSPPRKVTRVTSSKPIAVTFVVPSGRGYQERTIYLRAWRRWAKNAAPYSVDRTNASPDETEA